MLEAAGTRDACLLRQQRALLSRITSRLRLLESRGSLARETGLLRRNATWLESWLKSSQ